MAYSLTWDTTGYDFSEEIEKITWTDSTQIATELVPRRHGAIVTEEPVMSPRGLFLYGMIVQATAALAETRLNLLVKQMNSGAKQLRFDSNRYITCYKKDLNFEYVEGSGMTAVKYAIEFFAADPFWYKVSASTADQLADTNPEAWTHTYDGDAMVWPTITILADQGGSVVTFSLTNSTTSQTFSYAGTIASGQSLVINCANFTVANNGTSDLTNSSGSFIQLNSGANSFSYSGTTCTIRIAYTQRFFGPSWS
jgi:phage-related protein